MDLGWVRRASCDGFGVGQEGVMMDLGWRVRRMSCDGFGRGVGQEDVM